MRFTYSGQGYLAKLKDIVFDINKAREYFNLEEYTTTFKVATYKEQLNRLEQTLQNPIDSKDNLLDLIDMTYGCRFHCNQFTGYTDAFMCITDELLLKETGIDYKMSERDEVFKNFSLKIGITNPHIFIYDSYSYTK
jgi:hypothetical protein